MKQHAKYSIINAEDDPGAATMTVQYAVPGSARKVLASAIGKYPQYQAAPNLANIAGITPWVAKAF
ncbi:MAG: hypothetical protein IKD53_11460 [Clostridia bacterium]|nr:hypothetical protein [Clostridia bacterium]